MLITKMIIIMKWDSRIHAKVTSKPYTLMTQLGLKGSVVNIPIEINDIEVSPCYFDEMHTIQLKRHTDHKNDYDENFHQLKPHGAIAATKDR